MTFDPHNEISSSHYMKKENPSKCSWDVEFTRVKGRELSRDSVHKSDLSEVNDWWVNKAAWQPEQQFGSFMWKNVAAVPSLPNSPSTVMIVD